MSTQLSDTDLEDILNGACLYGAGGGGPYTLGQSLVADIKAGKKPVRLATPAEMTGTDSCCVSGGVGSPSAAAKGFDLHTARTAFDQLASPWGRLSTPVRPIELGAATTILPMTVAAVEGIPILDAAGAYRAVPQITQTAFALHGLPVGGVVLANATQQVAFTAGSAADTDATMRAIISGGTFTDDAGLALWAMDAAAAQRGSLTGTTESARRLGAALRTALQAGQDPVAAVAASLQGRVLIKGTVADEQQQMGEGTDTGLLVIKDEAGREVSVVSQNENLVAWSADSTRPAALAPDLIVTMTVDGQPFSNADLQLADGKQVAVIVAPTAAAMREPAMIAAFLPVIRSAGYYGAWFGV
mgnify:FL=1